MNNNYIDLHIHTKYSDGDDTVETILQNAQNNCLSVISFTDHNSVDAYFNINGVRKLFDGKVVTGVELTTTYNGEQIEILGYGFDIDTIHNFIKKNYYTFEQKTLNERLLILDQYKKKGIVLSDKFCRTLKEEPTKLYDPSHESCRDSVLEELKKHPENSLFTDSETSFRQMTPRDYLRNFYTNPMSPLYVDTSSLFPSIDSIIEEIHKAGGKCFIAHSMLYSNEFKNSIENILTEYSLDGFECHHSFFSKSQSEYLIDLCDKNNIYKSGGSDYHGASRPECILGKSTENQNIDISLSFEWLKGIEDYV